MTASQHIALALSFERLAARIDTNCIEVDMNPNDHTEMYRDGYNDALNGHPISANPYSLKKNRMSYERGHKAGQRELIKRAALISSPRRIANIEE